MDVKIKPYFYYLLIYITCLESAQEEDYCILFCVFLFFVQYSCKTVTISNEARKDKRMGVAAV